MTQITALPEVLSVMPNTQDDMMIFLFILSIPLLAAIVSLVITRPKLRNALVLLLSVTLFINIATLFTRFHNGTNLSVNFLEIIPGINLRLEIEPLGMLFALVASFLWIITTLYGIGYMNANKEKHHGRFFAFFSFSIFATLGVAFSGNLFTMFLFYELLTLATFPLVAHGGTEEAKKSGRTYLGILLGTSIAFQLTAIIWTYTIAGSLDFQPDGLLLGEVAPITAGILLLLFVYGIGKAALMPFHRWLPAAMVAPTPVSALLHAVAVVKAGVFAIVKVIVYIFGYENLSLLVEQHWLAGAWLTYIAGFTIIAASIIALKQDNLKKRLAYSTISQLSYVIMAASLLTSYAVMAAAFHILAHAVGKITLFFAAGSIYTASGKKYVSQLNGIGRRMPVTMTAFAIASLSMIGVPPAVGFISKYYMILATFETEHWFALGVIVLSTVLNALYFLPIIYAAFFKNEDVESSKNSTHGEAPLPILIALIVTAFLTIGFFIYPDMFLWLGWKATL